MPTDSNVPGEKPYPTQPFPTKPPAFIDQGVSLEDANNLTPEIKAMAQEQMREVPHRSAVHAAVARRNAAAARAGRRRQLGRRRVRSRDRLSVRARDARRRREPAWRRTTDPIRSSTVAYSNVFARGGEYVSCRRSAAHRAAVRGSDGHRPEQGRDRVAGAAGRRETSRSATIRC